MKTREQTSENRAAALLRVAAYLSQPQKFMAIADARAEMRRTLELAAKGSVVLTAHGEPEAAVVPFSTLEDMRRALLHLLVEEMEATFARTRERVRAQYLQSPTLNDDAAADAEKLVGEALRKARRESKSTRRMRG